MKKVLKFLMVTLLALTMISTIPTVSAAVTEDTAIDVIGNKQTVNISQTQNASEVTVKFTFTTTHPDVLGLGAGRYFIKYDTNKMDFVSGSMNHSKTIISMANEDYTTFPAGTPAEKGVILNGVAFLVSAQESEVTMKFTNLFKDGSRDPIEVEFINDVLPDQGLTLEKKDGTLYLPKSPNIQKATISLPALGLSMSGSNSVEKGKTSTYTTQLTNALDASKGVTWTLTGANNAGTKIDSLGNLTVAKDETASSVVVKATSVEDTSVSVSKTVTLSNPPQASVSIDGINEVIKGTKGTTFKSNVTNVTNKAVKWSLSGQNSASTTIDANGKLNVDINESAKALTIKATSVEDPTKSSTHVVKLVDKTYTIKKIELPNSKIEMEKGTKVEALEKEAQKNDRAKVTIVTNDGKTVTIEVPALSYKSDRDVVDEEGNFVVEKFNLIYTLKLPYITIDGDGKITESDKETNIIGDNTTSIPVGIGVKVEEDKPVIDVKPDNKGESNNNTSGGNINTDMVTKKEPVENVVKTSDDSGMMLYVMGMIGCGAVLAALLKRRKTKEN